MQYKQNHYAYDSMPMWATEETPATFRVYPSPRQSIIKLMWLQPVTIAIWLAVLRFMGNKIVEAGVVSVIACSGAAFLSLVGPVLAVWIKWSFTSDKTTDYLKIDVHARTVCLPRLKMQIHAGDPSHFFVHDFFMPGLSGTTVSELNVIRRDGDELLLWPILKHLGYGSAFNRIGKALMNHGFQFVRHNTRATVPEQGAPPYSKPRNGFLADERYE